MMKISKNTKHCKERLPGDDDVGKKTGWTSIARALYNRKTRLLGLCQGWNQERLVKMLGSTLEKSYENWKIIWKLFFNHLISDIFRISLRGAIYFMGTNAFIKGAKSCFPIFPLPMADIFLAREGPWPNAPSKYPTASDYCYFLEF